MVNRNFSHMGKSKVPRNMKLVDRRLKKDMKNTKQKMKKMRKRKH